MLSLCSPAEPSPDTLFAADGCLQAYLFCRVRLGVAGAGLCYVQLTRGSLNPTQIPRGLLFTFYILMISLGYDFSLVQLLSGQRGWLGSRWLVASLGKQEGAKLEMGIAGVLVPGTCC